MRERNIAAGTGDDGDVFVTAVRSALGESVVLRNRVAVTADAADWLATLATEVSLTLRALLAECIVRKQDGPSVTPSWSADVAAFPSQIHCLVEEVHFTANVESALREGGGASLRTLRTTLARQIAQYIAADACGSHLRTVQLKALLMDVIHHLSIVDDLVSRNVRDCASWHWQKQLRFYVGDEGTAVVRMVDALIQYGSEYQGNVSRLVHTPLTDKCYLVLSQAMAFGYGGNPYGPAGTGKTESVKALGAAVARRVLVFNCDEGIDMSSMGRIFTGLVASGAWGCFDEFNRLREEQLSAVSQQIQAIQIAIGKSSTYANQIDKDSCVTLLGRSIRVHPHSGIFITLNPAGRGYGGRSRLPDNLTALFRPIAMAAPDINMIAEVVLRSEGFVDASRLGAQTVTIFKLASQLLSDEQHYDWGLRAIKTVLCTAGKLMAESQRGAPVTSATEVEQLLRAIRVNTLSKLVTCDYPRFCSILADTFPGVLVVDVHDVNLAASVLAVSSAAPFCFTPNAMQIMKLMQLHEALEQRIGCAILGFTGATKSTIWRLLAASLRCMGTPVIVHVINPKAMSKARLLGELDQDTREWTDGVLTAAVRAAAIEESGTRTWIVCDGDIDPEWIEALNSVLDDNRLLTLPSGERISLCGVAVNFIFETDNIMHASPATVSRLAIIYVPSDGGFEESAAQAVSGWLGRIPVDAPVRTFAALIGKILPLALRQVAASAPHLVLTITATCAATAALVHIESASSRADVARGLVYGLCASVPRCHAEQLAQQIVALTSIEMNGLIENPTNAETTRACVVAALTGETLTAESARAGATVMTPRFERLIATLAPWMSRGEPMLLMGSEGAGKASLVRLLVAQRCASVLTVLCCTCSTTGDDVVTRIRQHCELQSSADGRVFRPRDGDRLVLYIRGVDVPTPDRYGTSNLGAFLLQLLTYGGFYDEDRAFLHVDCLHVIASLATCSGTRTGQCRPRLAPRLVAAFRVACVDAAEPAELVLIVGARLTAAIMSITAVVGDAKVDARFTGALAGAAFARLANTIVEVFVTIADHFPATCIASYSSFSLRDLHQWVTRMLTQYGISEGESILAIACAEGFRVFCGRLATDEDRARCVGIFHKTVTNDWGANAAAEAMVRQCEVYTTLTSRVAAGGVSSGCGDRNIDVGILRRTSMLVLRGMVERCTTLLGRERQAFDVVLTPCALNTIAEVDRAISRRGGCALLIGLPGAGRRTAVAVVACIYGMRVTIPTTSRAYGLRSFLAELKPVIVAAGTSGEPAIVLLEDRHLEAPGVMDAIHTLLTSGDIPYMWAAGELELLLCSAPRRPGIHPDSLMKGFAARVQATLHIIIVLDSAQTAFEKRVELYPTFLDSSRCDILWLGGWCPQTEHEIASTSLTATLAAYSVHMAPTQLIDMLLAMHASPSFLSTRHKTNTENESAGVNAAQRTPRELMSLLQCFRGIVTQLTERAAAEEDRLAHGLAKLSEAAHAIDDLVLAADAQRSELRVRCSAVDNAMKEITVALTEAASQKLDVEKLGDGFATAERETLARRADIEKELSSVQPMLDAARTAVSGIRRDQLDEIRSLKVPPEAVADVLSAVLLMLGNADTSWLAMKRFLSTRGVKDEIIGFDAKRSLQPDARRAVAKLIFAKAASFEDTVITRASVAAAPLAAWVRANLKYATVLEDVAPLDVALSSANAALGCAQDAVIATTSELARLDARVNELKVQFGARVAEAELAKTALAASEDELARAGALLNDLAGERVRWSSRARELHESRPAIPIQAALTAGFVSYLGVADEVTRTNVMLRWTAMAPVQLGTSKCGTSRLPAFNVVQVLSSECQLQSWHATGLPSDTMSSENAALALSCYRLTGRAPLLVDPDGAATAWLIRHVGHERGYSSSVNSLGASCVAEHKAQKRHYKSMSTSNCTDTSGGGPVDVVSARDARSCTAVEQAVRFGKTLVLLDIEIIPSYLTHILRNSYEYQDSSRRTVALGDKTVEVHEDFRIFLSTRDASFCPSPDVAASVISLRASVTHAGLASQLLSIALAYAAPESERRQSILLHKYEKTRVLRGQAENDLLSALASSSSSSLICDNSLLAVLAHSRACAVELEEIQSQEADAAHELNTKRTFFAPVALFGTRAYFCIQALRELNPMYSFGLPVFLALFRAVLLAKNFDGGIQPTAPDSICSALCIAVFQGIAGALVKRDRLTFALHLARSIGAARLATDDENCDDATWDLLLAGGVTSDDVDIASSAFIDKPHGPDDNMTAATRIPTWVPRKRRGAFLTLLRTAPEIEAMVLCADASSWVRWCSSTAPESTIASLVSSASSTICALLVHTLRPDRVHLTFNILACNLLGVKSLSVPAISFTQMMAAADSISVASDGRTVPILLVSSVGTDPSRDLADFGSQTVGNDHYIEFAMGGSSDTDAISKLHAAALSGSWLCLKNLHLVADWLPTLERALDLMSAPHPLFRLWFATEPHAHFSATLLQRCYIVALEAPPGLRANMQGTLTSWGDNFLLKGGPLRAHLLFSLAWLHAVLQERRSYAPQGWVRNYDFSAADLRAGVVVVEALLVRKSGGRHGATKSHIPWAFLHGMLESVVYGGRIDIAPDVRVLRAYLSSVFHPDVIGGRRAIATSAPSSGTLEEVSIFLPGSATATAADFARVIAALPDNCGEFDARILGLPMSAGTVVHRTATCVTLAALRMLSLTKLGATVREMNHAPLPMTWRATLVRDVAHYSRVLTMDIDSGTRPLYSAAESEPLMRYIMDEATLGDRAAQHILGDMTALSRAASARTTDALDEVGLREVASALLTGTVPSTWAYDWSDGPTDGTPLEWIMAVKSRRTSIATLTRRCATTLVAAIPNNTLCCDAEVSRLLDSPITLSSFFRPEAFLSALLQQTMRFNYVTRRMVATADLRLVAAWGDETNLRAVARGALSLCAAVSGLTMQGAAVDVGGMLIDTMRDSKSSDAVEGTTTPTLVLAWTMSPIPELYAPGTGLAVPLYTEFDRKRLIEDVTLPVGLDRARWVLTGTCLVVNGVKHH